MPSFGQRVWQIKIIIIACATANKLIPMTNTTLHSWLCHHLVPDSRNIVVSAGHSLQVLPILSPCCVSFLAVCGFSASLPSMSSLCLLTLEWYSDSLNLTHADEHSHETKEDDGDAVMTILSRFDDDVMFCPFALPVMVLASASRSTRCVYCPMHSLDAQFVITCLCYLWTVRHCVPNVTCPLYVTVPPMLPVHCMSLSP